MKGYGKSLVLSVLVLVFLLCLAGCWGKPDDASIPDISELRNLVSEGYTDEEIFEVLSGQNDDSLRGVWGEPDGFLYGFWGETWDLGEKTGRHITVYYDKNGFVEYIRISEKDT